MLFFGERHPCKMWQQEPKAPAAIFPEKTVQAATRTEEREEQPVQQKLTYTHTSTISIFNNT